MTPAERRQRAIALAAFPHRWSGWPGCWCLDCGVPDPVERCIVTHDADPRTCEDHRPGPCPEPGSRRHDPYDPAIRVAEGDDAARAARWNR